MPDYKCPCGETKEVSGVSIKFVDGEARHDVKCSCGKYMELSNPKSGAPSFRSNRWGQVY